MSQPRTGEVRFKVVKKRFAKAAEDVSVAVGQTGTIIGFGDKGSVKVRLDDGRGSEGFTERAMLEVGRGWPYVACKPSKPKGPNELALAEGTHGMIQEYSKNLFWAKVTSLDYLSHGQQGWVPSHKIIAGTERKYGQCAGEAGSRNLRASNRANSSCGAPNSGQD